MSACRVDGCDRDTSKGGKGLCGMHYARARCGKDIGPAGAIREPGRTVAERVYPRLVADGECWTWTGGRVGPGYGAIGVGPKVEYVHRWVYEDLVGPIPAGLVIDHLCLNRACANPLHLDVVTRAENNRRGGLTTGERAA